MSDLDISGILNSLSKSDIDNLKKVAEGIIGKNETPDAAPPKKVGESVVPFDFSNIGFPDLSVISKLAPIIGEFNKHDERADFISALKPLLSEGRRKKADEAAKLIKLMSVIPLLKDGGLL